ncbi:MAG: transposase [Ignavibacteria bacterium]|nr:MAG: transposase [Ignavibacteria bacterium]
MKHPPRIYDEAFKRRAPEMVAAGRTLASVARELGIDVKRLSYWKRTLELQQLPGRRHLTSLPPKYEPCVSALSVQKWNWPF